MIVFNITNPELLNGSVGLNLDWHYHHQTKAKYLIKRLDSFPQIESI